MGSYARPASLDEALQFRAGRPCTVLAGGTDFWPARGQRPVADDILDLSLVAGLRGIKREPGQLRLGATTTWTDVMEARLPAYCAALVEAAREVGGVQIQNAGTIAGNLCNASPAADGVPALLALDARVEMRGPRGVREVPLDAFVLGSRRTACAADELVTAILVPERSSRARSRFVKLGARRYLVISIAMVAALVDADDAGVVAHAAVAVGACSAVARRLPALEARLVGMPLAAVADTTITATDLSPITPIDDIRATAAYRREAVVELVRRALAGCSGRST